MKNRKKSSVSTITGRQEKAQGSPNLSPLTEQRYSGKDVHIPVHNRNRNPQVFVREDDLLAEVARLICWELDHAKPRPESRGVDVPVKVRLLRIWL